MPLKPQPKLLTIWRILLVIGTCVPALVCSIVLKIGGFWWTLFTCVWVILFLAVYLIYLPMRYRKLSFQLKNDILTVYGGVFYTVVNALPLNNVQFTVLVSSPAHRIFGLCTLRVVATGAVISIPGLRIKDAKSLASLVSQ